MLVTRDTSHCEMSPLNDFAPENMPYMFFVLDTSHFEISPLKEYALENIRLMSVILDTSHSPIGPCGLFQQSSGDSLRQSAMALLSSSVDVGEKTALHLVSDIDPCDPTNMRFLIRALALFNAVRNGDI